MSALNLVPGFRGRTTSSSLRRKPTHVLKKRRHRALSSAPHVASRDVQGAAESSTRASPGGDGEGDYVCAIDIVTGEPICGDDCRFLGLGPLNPNELGTSEHHFNYATEEESEAEGETYPLGTDSPTNEEATDRSTVAVSPFAAMVASYRSAAEITLTGRTPGGFRPSRSAQDNVQQEYQGTFLPAYRASPLLAEIQRQRDASTTTRVLFLDEGGEVRALLGAAIMRHMLGRLRARLDVSVDWASLGPPTGRALQDPRVRNLAQAMGLAPRSMDIGHMAVFPYLKPAALASPQSSMVRRFDEVEDAVRYDLILVMDRFDFQEIMRDVAVLDTINPGGHYAGRIRLLGPFAWAAKRVTLNRVVVDIPDPSYEWHVDESKEDEAFQETARALALSCRGLATYLLDLETARRRRRVAIEEATYTLRDALDQSLRCPLLAGELPGPRDRGISAMAKRQQGKASSDKQYTVRAIHGRRHIVHRPMKPRGFWKSIENVDCELREFMKEAGMEHLPTQRELRAAGASSLASAVDSHGGLAVFSARLKVTMSSRRPNGYWEEFKNLERALRAYLKPIQAKGNSAEPQKLMMPTVQELRAAGRADLIRALRIHGGSAAVARRLGVAFNRGEGWADEVALLAELRLACVNDGIEGSPDPPKHASRIPSRKNLLSIGRSDLVYAVEKMGGFPYFRGLDRSIRHTASDEHGTDGLLDVHNTPAETRPPPIERSRIKGVVPLIDEVAAAMLDYLASGGEMTNRLPTRAELCSAGRHNLWNLVQRCGGGRRLAEHMGLRWVETRGRRREVAAQKTDGDELDRLPDPQAEIDMLDCYEEFVIL